MVQLVQIGRGMGAQGGSGTAGPPIAGSSLYLGFAAGVYWDGAPASIGNIITVSRASSAYTWDASGAFTLISANTARINNNGILIENAATQLVQNNTSTAVSAAANNLTFTGSQTSPDPSNANAVRMTDNAVNNAHNFSTANASFTSGATYVVSAICKAGTNSLIQISPGSAVGGANFYANFDLSNGTVTRRGSSTPNADIVSLGGGWYLCYVPWVSIATTSAPAATVAMIGSSTATRNAAYVGTGTNVTFWMMQTEAGSYPSSPIPNSTAGTVTRAADNITITGTTAAAAVYAAKSAYSDTNNCTFSTANVVLNVNSALLLASSNTAMRTSNGTTTATATIGSSGTIRGSVQTAYGFDGISLTVAANGGSFTSVAAAWGATSGTITLGNRAALDQSVNGFIKILAVSPTSGNYNPVRSSQVATGTRVPNFVSSSASFQSINSRTRHIATDDITSLKIGLTGWSVVTSIETNAGVAATCEASVEYPQGNIVRIKFSGADVGSIADGATLYSDDTSISIPSGAVFFINCYRNCASPGMPICNNSATTLVDTADGEIFENSAANASKVMSPGTMANTSTVLWHGPAVILGQTRKSTVILFGDSICFGQGQNVATSSTCFGVVSPSLGSVLGHANFGSPGGTVTQWNSTHTKQMALAVTCNFTHAIVQLGRNDVTNGGAVLATIQTQMTAAWTTIVGTGMKVAQTTITPRSTSTDGWTTTANQTAASNPTIMADLNTWLLGVPSPLTTVFDVASAVENSPGTSIWKAPGGVAYTGDGTHPTPPGYAAVVTAGVINTSNNFFAR